MALGESVDVDVAHLFPDLTGNVTAPESAIAALTLKSIDQEEKQARLDGTVQAKVMTDLGGALHPFEFSGPFSVLLDLEKQRVSAIEMDAKFICDDKQGGMELKFWGTLKVAMSCETGAAPAKARKRKLKFRNTPRKLESLGLSVELPSHYQDIGEKVGLGPKFFGFAAGIDEGIVLRRVGFRVIPSQGDVAKEADQGVEALKGMFPDAKVKKCKTSAGKGKTLTMTVDGDYVVTEDIIAADGAIIMVIMSSPPSLKKQALKDLAVIRKSIQQIDSQ